ncbi:MAG TPA: hypothetical protein VF139_02000 [Candidatus Polarisedimenticolaceae bacterium]
MNPVPRDLRRLAAIADRSDGDTAAEKLALVRRLAKATLPSAASVLRLHELLCRLRAYPDDREILDAVERALVAFPRRRDLARHREALGDSGLAGTAIRYRFFWPMARWLASRWPDRLRYDRRAPDPEPRLRAALPALLPAVAAEAAKRFDGSAWATLDRLRGRATDAAYLVGRLASLEAGPGPKEALHDGIDAAYVLEAGPGAPSRTLARLPGGTASFGRGAHAGRRPDLVTEMRRPPHAVRAVPPREAERLIDLAREAMVTRSRDLDAFAWGNPGDVRVVDDGDGLRFVLIGMLPDRRLPLPAAYGWLTVRNGVPIGYVQTDVLLSAAEVAFNTFPTYRGLDAARVFSRVLAVSRAVFGARAFSIEPYQLGHGNAEGIESGAWWFYRKLGFRPKDPEVRAIESRERDRLRRNPGHRSTAPTLEALAASHLYFEPEPGTRAWVARAPRLGLALDPGAGDRAQAACGVRSFRGWSATERAWWSRLAPVVASLPGMDAWTPAQRRALAAVVRAKAARRETAFLDALDAHPRAGAALAARLARA